jgi:hypothetical protein
VEPSLPPRESEEWPNGGFVAAIPFEAPSAEFYPEVDAVFAAEEKGKRESRRDNIEAVKMMTVARDVEAANIVADDVQSEADVDTLLRVIPFNVVAPNIDGKVKNFIKYNYSDVKPKFPQVDTLFHWPEVDEEKLVQVLQELDESAGDERVCDDWEGVVDEIMAEIKELAEASQMSVYAESSSPVSTV